MKIKTNVRAGIIATRTRDRCAPPTDRCAPQPRCTGTPVYTY